MMVEGREPEFHPTSESHGLYATPLKSGEIMGDISTSGDVAFGTIIAAKNFPFRDPFPALLQRPLIYP